MTSLRFSDMQINFFTRKGLEKWPDINQLTAADVDAIQHRFRGGIDVWIVQSWLNLRQELHDRGIRAEIGKRFARGGITIAHRDELSHWRYAPWQSYLVGVRADRARSAIADIEILQNDLEMEPKRTIHIPHWPQPGIIPRDPQRQNELKKVAYFGRDWSLPSWMASDEFKSGLERIGIEFHVMTNVWHDYADVDVVLAYRDEATIMLRQKPASKLVNAWLAGVPAILAREPAYERLIETDSDAIFADGCQAVLDSLTRLKNHPELYAQMRMRCAVRAADYGRAQIKAQWLQALDEVIIPQWRVWSQSRAGMLVDMQAYMRRRKTQLMEDDAFAALKRKQLQDLA